MSRYGGVRIKMPHPVTAANVIVLFYFFYSSKKKKITMLFTGLGRTVLGKAAVPSGTVFSNTDLLAGE